MSVCLVYRHCHKSIDFYRPSKTWEARRVRSPNSGEAIAMIIQPLASTSSVYWSS